MCGYEENEPVAVCVGCGCTDLQACRGGCAWLDVDYDDRTGVCSRCPEKLDEWRLDHCGLTE